MEIDKLEPILTRQLGAAIEMPETHMRACPGELSAAPMWKNDSTPAGFSEFWYVAYHSLFWFDLYLDGQYDGFNPPLPFTLTELYLAGVLPDRVYALEELLEYLAHCQEKCRRVIEGLTDKGAAKICQLN